MACTNHAPTLIVSNAIIAMHRGKLTTKFCPTQWKWPISAFLASYLTLDDIYKLILFKKGIILLWVSIPFLPMAFYFFRKQSTEQRLHSFSSMLQAHFKSMAHD